MASDLTEFLDAVRALSPEDVVYAVADVWDAMGWETRVTQARTDGVDVIATRTEPVQETHIIRVKGSASGTTLGAQEVRAYAGLVRQIPDADAAVLVTTGRVSDRAREVAQDTNVKLIDAEEFAQLYRAYVWDPAGDTASAADRQSPSVGPEPEGQSAPSSRRRLPGSRIGTVAGVLDALALGVVLAGSGVKRLGNGSMIDGLLRLLLAAGMVYIVLRVAPGVTNVPDVPLPFLIA